MSRLRRIARKAAQLYRAVWRVRPFAAVYPHVRDVPAKGAGFISPRWAEGVAGYTAGIARELADAPAPRFASAEAVCLPLLASMIHVRKGRVSIFDIGGAAGIAYVQVRQVVPAEAIEYHLVDNATVLAAARRAGYLPADAQLHEELPEQIRPDIVHAASVIQYIEDYRAFLERLARYEPQYIALINSPIGDMPTCAVAQVNVAPGTVLPYWFLNAAEVSSIMNAAGYRLMFSSACERDYDLSNLPASHRLTEPRNLIFVRGEQT